MMKDFLLTINRSADLSASTLVMLDLPCINCTAAHMPYGHGEILRSCLQDISMHDRGCKQHTFLY